MNNESLEKYYEEAVLPRYASVQLFREITWIDHGKVDNDAWAHYFKSNGTEYVLLYEDSPGGSFLDDNLSHELITIDGESSVNQRFRGKKDVPNLAGWFTLYKEKNDQ